MKEEKPMEKNYKVDVIYKDEKIYLKFDFETDEKYMIDFASEDQTTIRNIFYKLVELCYKHKPILVLSEKTDDFPGCDLHREIAEDYIIDLNKEIELIYFDIKENDK